MPMREISRILCKDENGKSCQLIVYEHFTTIEASSGGQCEVTGHQEARLLDGSIVTYRNKDTFEVVKTGKLIRRI